MGITLKTLLRKHRMKRLLELEIRPRKLGKIAGFVVEITDAMILMHVLEMNAFQLNGYCAVLTQMVGRYRVFDKRTYWQSRAVKRLGIRPKQPRGIFLETLPALIASVAKSYPLITIHQEKKKPEVCYIGCLKDATAESFAFEDLDCNAEWTGPRRMKFSDVTRVDFGGGYENALALTAPKLPTKKV